MAKAQMSKRSRDARKAAAWAGLRMNTGHPSHLHKGDGRAEARLAERRLSCGR